MLNIWNEIWQWSLTNENMRYLAWAKPEFICMLLPLLHPFSCRYLPWMETRLSKKYLVKEIPHRPAQIERGLQWFKTSFWLPDSSTTNSYCLILKKEERSYTRRGISNKQPSKTLHHSSTSTEKLKGRQ